MSNNKFLCKVGVSTVLSGALMLSATANAGNNMGVAAKLSTLGLGGEVSYNINQRVSVALGANGFTYDYDTEEDGIDYDGEIAFNTFSLSGRYHPMANGFFLGGSMVVNNNEITLDAQPTQGGTFEFNNQTYTTDDIASAQADVDFDNLAPQLSIGWQSTKEQGLSVFAEAGVMITGEPKLSYTFDCASDVQAQCDRIRQDVDQEKEELEKDLEDLNLWPVLALGIQYNF